MAAKQESKEAVAIPPPKGAEAPAAAPKGSGAGAWIAAIAAIVLAPAASIAIAQFVLIPRFEKKLATPGAVGTAAAASGGADAKGEHKGGEGKGEGPGNSYDFSNVVVNLAGTMGTRYLKTSFTITGADGTFKQAFEANKDRMTDVTINVLSALTLADLEEPGSKNILRDKLVAAYNQAIGHHAVEQVYFKDFLVQ